MISLSDNLKPWEVIERRLIAACDGDFVIALYNPASQARPQPIYDAFRILRDARPPTTPVAFARAVGRADERITLTTLAEADPGVADMSTLVLIGASTTRFIARPGRAPVRADAAQLRGATMSVDPAQRRFDIVERRRGAGAAGGGSSPPAGRARRAASSLAQVASPPLFLLTRISMRRLAHQRAARRRA